MTRPDASANPSADDIAAPPTHSPSADSPMLDPVAAQQFSAPAADVAAKPKTSDSSRRKTPTNARDDVSSTRSSNRNAYSTSSTEIPSDVARSASSSSARKAQSLREKPDEASSSLKSTNSLSRFAFFRSLMLPSSVWNQPWDSEDQRAEAYNYELFGVFRQRVCLVALLAMAGLLAYAAFSLYLAPRSIPLLLIIYGAMYLIEAAAFAIAPHLTDVKSLRWLCMLCYGFFSLGAGLIIVVMGRENNFIMGCHSHIVLTTLLLPLAVSECFLICAIAFASLAVSSWFSLMPGQEHLFYSNLFMLGNTTISVLFIAYFQNVLRRNAFNSTFEKVVAAARFENLSCLDTLTGGYNRRHLEQTLELELARSIRFNRPLSLLLFDLDNFKSVNDTNGHAAGDQVLKEVWSIATGCIREVDTAARYGGDEFAIILPESDEDSALHVAARLQDMTSKVLRAQFGLNSLESLVTLSIGVTTVHPHRAVRVSEVIALADAQLYNAKRKGKNSIVY